MTPSMSPTQCDLLRRDRQRHLYRDGFDDDQSAGGGTDLVISADSFILDANFENLTLSGTAISGRATASPTF